MRNGRIDRYLFEGGYAQASVAGSTTDNFAFYYYNRDHLGNIREVVDASGKVKQATNYYPFGAPYFDDSATKASDFQPYKYNGKELDRMHGLDTYDYGDRQHDPILCRWDRMDPLAEKNPGISPYHYCHNNPVNRVDPDGRDGVRIIDPTNQTITIKATYFVRTTSKMYRDGNRVMSLSGYSDSDIKNMNNYSNELNKMGYSISEGDYSGYKVVFDLRFVDGKDLSPQKIVEEYEGYDISNTIEPGNEYTNRNLHFKETINSDGSTSVVGGVTSNNKNIVMNVGTDYTDTDSNRKHEMFHTLGAQHPKGSGASSGIMAYPPQQPNQSDINKLMNNNILKDVYK